MTKDPQEKLKQFFLQHRKILYRKKEIILRIDDMSSGVFYLSEGYVKDYALSPDGGEFNLVIFNREDIFPYSFAFNNLPNAHSFQAMTDCVVYKVTLPEFLDFIDNNPDVLFMLMKKILIRLRGVLKRMEYLAFGNAKQRVSGILHILGERFGETTKDGIHIQLPLSHLEIAELVGLTRETASVQVEKLEKKGIIKRISKQYIILLPDKLKIESRLNQ